MPIPMPMNFAYQRQGPLGWKFYGTRPDLPTTMDAVMAGARTSTLRKGIRRDLQPGAEVLFTDNQGRQQPAVVTGRRMVDPSMADELSTTELWTPEFLRWYMGNQGLEGGRMEQLLYRVPAQQPRMAGDAVAAALTPSKPVWAFGGARVTPPDIQELMSEIAAKAVSQGKLIAHGGAPGADRAAGRLITDPAAVATYLAGHADLRGPDPVSSTQFQVFNSKMFPTWNEAVQLARQYEDPYRPGGRDYNARNMYVLLGSRLKDPRERLVVWTPGGQVVGGTGHAIRAAQGLGIPVRNLGNPQTLAAAQEWLRS